MPSGKITPVTPLTGKLDKNVGTNDHNKLINKDLADQHPIKAITGLLDTLNSLDSKISTLDQKVDSEADFVASELVLIKDNISSIETSISEISTDYINKFNQLSEELVNQINFVKDLITVERNKIIDLEHALSEATAQLNTRITEVDNSSRLRDESITDRIDNISIESLSKRKIYEVLATENPAINDGFELAHTFSVNTVYFEYIESENAYKWKVIHSAEEFISDTYYVYNETNEVVNTSNAADKKSEGYYLAYTYDPAKEYYQLIYDANDESLIGMWELPLKPDYIGDWPDWAFGWINETPGYFYNQDEEQIYFERTGALMPGYGIRPDNECWGFAVGYSWNGNYGIIEKGRYIYPDKSGAWLGNGWSISGWNQPDTKRFLYYTHENSYFANAFKATGAVKASDALLPFGTYPSKTRYKKVDITVDSFIPGQYYTYFKQTYKKPESAKIDFIVKAKNYNAETQYYQIKKIDLVSKQPIFEKVDISERDFYKNYKTDYYKILTVSESVVEYETSRIQLEDSKSVYKDQYGNEVVEVRDNDIFLNGEGLTPKLTTNTNIEIDKVLENNAEEIYENPLTSLILTVPSGIKHGFCSYISFETNDRKATAVTIVNNSKFPLKIIQNGEVIAQKDLEINLECQYNLMFLCNGKYTELYIQEIQLLD